MSVPTASRPVVEEIKQLVPQVDSGRLSLLEMRFAAVPPSPSFSSTPPPDRSPQPAAALRSLLHPPATVAHPSEAKADVKMAPTDTSGESSDDEDNMNKARVPSPTTAPAAPVRKRRPKSDGSTPKRKRGQSSDVEDKNRSGEKKLLPPWPPLPDNKEEAMVMLRLKEAELQLREENVRKRELGLTGELVEFKQKTRTTMIDLLRKQVQSDRLDARNRLATESARLGQVVYERHGTNFIESWQDGSAFKLLALRKARSAELQADVERMKKSSKKKGAKPLEVGEVEDLAARLLILKRESDECEIEEKRLSAMKDLHIREIKRVMDEDKSRFNDCPQLPTEGQRKPGQDFVLMTLLGKGGFSEVFKAFDLTNFREVACKIHQLNPHWNDAKKQNYLKHAIREYEIHKTLVNSKVVRLYDVFEIDSNSFCTVLEYCEGTDLDFYLKTHKTLPEKEARAIMVQIFWGLKYLNEQKRPIIHYDLKPANILFHKGEVKITDFGLSKVMEEDQSHLELTSQGAGTYWYLPPECFETNREAPPRISSKVDVWSCGVMFYQMLYGRKPFGNNVSQQKILNERLITIDTQVEFPTRPIVSASAKTFIKKCLTPLQALRPDVIACASDEYLSAKSRKTDMPPPDPVDVSNL